MNKHFIVLGGIVLGFVVLFLVLLGLERIEPQDDVIEYNDFRFVKDGPLWNTLIARRDGQTFILPFRNLPQDTQSVIFDPSVIRTVYGAQSAIITFDTYFETDYVNITIAAVQLGSIIGEKYGILNKPTAGATTNPQDNTTRQADCDDATNQTVVIKLQKANYTSVVQENNCVLVSGTSGGEIVRATDHFVYRLVGIIQ